MNISERLTKWMTETGMTAVLQLDGKDSTTEAQFVGWTSVDGQARGSAVFGPYPSTVHASGIRILVDGAADDITFASMLALPAGQTFRYTLTVGVS